MAASSNLYRQSEKNFTIYTFSGAVACDRILQRAIFTIRTSLRILGALLHGTLAAGVSQTLRRGARNGITELSHRAPPIGLFGWAAITLGIGPHCSLTCIELYRVCNNSDYLHAHQAAWIVTTRSIVSGDHRDQSKSPKNYPVVERIYTKLRTFLFVCIANPSLVALAKRVFSSYWEYVKIRNDCLTTISIIARSCKVTTNYIDAPGLS